MKPVVSGPASMLAREQNLVDLLIKNGIVVDGSGGPAFSADIVVDGGRICEVGDCKIKQATKIIDAHGLAVCPGFIDMHTHSDISLLANPRQESKVMQGVTTEVLGQDGLSYAPVDAVTLSTLRKSLTALNGDAEGVSWDWTSVGDFLSRFDGNVAVNVCYLVPHAAIRLMVLGEEDRLATDGELARMQAAVVEAMREGAVGFSTGLTYAPCAFSDTRELVACCRGIEPFGGYFAPHLRSYGGHFTSAIEEALQVARESSVSLHLTHFHCSFEVNKDRVEEILAHLDQAAATGIKVTLDSYPYTAGSTFLGGFFPSWVHGGGPNKFLARISSLNDRKRIQREMEEEGCDGYSHVPVEWEKIAVAGVGSLKNQWMAGKSVAELARLTGKSAFDFACGLLIDENLQVSCLAFFGYDKNVQAIMKHPAHMVGTDGLLVGSRPHPRAYGTFARYLQHYTRELKLLTLEACIQKMTSLPAAVLGLHDRGFVRKGQIADLVVFNPESVEDTATYENPRNHPRGIQFVLVNGKVVVEYGKHTGVLAGQVLRRHA